MSPIDRASFKALFANCDALLKYPTLFFCQNNNNGNIEHSDTNKTGKLEKKLTDIINEKRCNLIYQDNSPRYSKQMNGKKKVRNCDMK